MLMKIRRKEISHFEEAVNDIRFFVQICKHFSVETDIYNTVLEKFSQLDEFSIANLCHPVGSKTVHNLDSYVPTICGFEVDEELITHIQDLKRNSSEKLFIKLWTKRGGKCVEDKKGIPLTIEEVISKVWKPVYEDLTTAKRIQNGSMFFREFQTYYMKTGDNLINDLKSLSADGSVDWINEKMDQFLMYSTVQQCVEGATTIKNVIDTYDLEGQFEHLNIILELANGKDIAMYKLDKDLRRTMMSLKGMTGEQKRCLEAFIDCKPLVEWIRRTMRNRKELLVFIDLASITVEDSDMEFHLVQFFQPATLGYGPLIFNINEIHDLKYLLETCELVWKEINSDPSLHEKLKMTTRKLEWYKSLECFPGSVPLTSVKQADAINSGGIYMLGKIDPNTPNEKLSLEDVLQLYVQIDSQGRRSKMRFTYNTLQELQHKIMMVDSKDNSNRVDAEKFIEIFNAVVRLCNVYIKLVSSGCVLFSNWQARFLCDPERKVCAFLKFENGEGCIQLKGRKTKEEDIKTTIPRITKFMEKCLENWLNYIEQKRDEYHHLNFFTIDQIVILQRELVLMGGEVEPNDFIYPILSIVKHDCAKMDVIDALMKANIEVSKKEDEVKSAVMENSAVAEFVSEMMKSGFSETSAKKALRAGIDPTEIDEGIVWCMEFEDHPDLQAQVVKDYKGWTETDKTISSMIQNVLSRLQCEKGTTADTLIPDLEQLWEEFLSSISSSVSDYLSVEHLGIILSRLAETETFTVNRPFPRCFEKGQPNLLLCQQDEILNTVLTIYSHDPDQPLPQSDEILMCTPHTTLDEVEIFWRRAVLDTTDRIYCLVYGDLLDYEVSDKGERRLKHHMQKAARLEIPYKLVVVCSTEREYHSRIVAALDKYRRPPLPLMTHDNMTKYIKDKLTFDIKRPSATPAAEADFDLCTVRVVKSWRAGVGKSLHKKRSAEKLKVLNNSVIRSKKAVVSIPLHDKEISIDGIMDVLLQNTLPPEEIEPRLFHIDLSYEVQEGVDYLLFQLLILGCLTNSTGHVWRKLPYDLYIVETMLVLARDFQEQTGYFKCKHRCLDILPAVTCRSPRESLKKYQGYASGIDQNDLLFDEKEFKSDVFQRPFQYLYRLDMGRGLGDVDMRRTEGNPQTCLQTLLKYCGIRDPSWAELRNFVWFLNTQLVDFETSDFVCPAVAEDLPGFSQFVVRFLIQMSRDFATRSLNMSEESPIQMLQRMESEEEEENEEVMLRQFQLRRTWES
ncbi:E3 ubiquitin-protein ligase RNF213-like, partial [Saccostrea cucullata]|uniref:E3 ubiquitin-protein ligase RNF213-like n=1 Tax=Saccostrea cuccullata TaxID=36930 RepID=UPI002ED6A31D